MAPACLWFGNGNGQVAAQAPLRHLTDRQSQNMTVTGRETAKRKVFCAPVVAGGDTPLLLQPTKHDLNPVAPPVAALVVADHLAARLPARNAEGVFSYPSMLP